MDLRFFNFVAKMDKLLTTVLRQAGYLPAETLCEFATLYHAQTFVPLTSSSQHHVRCKCSKHITNTDALAKLMPTAVRGAKWKRIKT
jgi:hypothetical protein